MLSLLSTNQSHISEKSTLNSFSVSLIDTLPSPSNLKRWKLTAEASCFLCNKDTCTTSHIHSACKVALSQGRFTFRHDNVLRIIITNIRSSIKNMKSTVPTSRQPIKIKFLKKGTRVKKQEFFSQWDITSGIRLGLVRRSRWLFFLSTSHSIH